MADEYWEEISDEQIEGIFNSIFRKNANGDQSWEELERAKNIWKKYGWFYRLLRGAILILILGLIGVAIYSSPTARESFSVNLFTAVMSAVATALIFDELNRKRSQEQYKMQLVDDAASMSNEIAKNAVHQIRRKGWLQGEDGLLKGANLINANLQAVNLSVANLAKGQLGYANLSDANLMNANLQSAFLLRANLHKAFLDYANLQNAYLHETNLQGASLEYTNLQEADLSNARLQGANLSGANLQGVTLSGEIGNGMRFLPAEFDQTTILPDESKWTSGTDMRRFTDAKHLDFWRSDYSLSPAYRGKSEE